VIPGSAFAHLVTMSDEIGTFEHADHDMPRREHGYCSDDMARVLVAVCREPRPTRAVVELGRTAFRFLIAAQGVDGRIRNRRASNGRWSGRRTVEDCWGRSVGAFGTAARQAPDPWMRQMAMSYFTRGAEQRSPSPRAMAFAALGAADVLEINPRHLPARRVLREAVATIGPIGDDPAWPWPEARLAYANAALTEALLAAGHALGQPAVVADGLTLLGWLLDRESVHGHLSLTPVGGSGPGDVGSRFDQQPIEAAAMAGACARAHTLTGEDRWARGVELAAAWFDGRNDVGVAMSDPETGGGYDGLHADRVNRNQGTESTLAFITTMQLVGAPTPALT
jgi:hypothetical protein